MNPDSVVVELADPTDTSSGLFEACQHIKQLGFKLAIDDPMMVGSKHDIFPLIDIVKVDVTKGRFETIEKQIPVITMPMYNWSLSKLTLRTIFQRALT